MAGAHQILSTSSDLTKPLSETAVHGLALATDNLPTKFEISISTHDEDKEGNTKCRTWGGGFGGS